MRVMSIIPCSYGGGAERLVLDQLKHYDKKIAYSVVALRKGNIEDQFSKHKEYQCLNSKSKLSLATIRRLNKLIRQNNIQILHSHLMEADFYAWIMKLLNPRIKWISTRHAKDPFRKNLFWGLANWFMSLWNEKVIVVAESVRDYTQKHEFIPEKKLELIHNGIDTKRFKKGKKNLRKELGLSRKDFVVGVVGRVDLRKGHKVLIDAIADMDHVKLLIIGTGPLEKDLKKYVKEKKIGKRAIFAGFREDIVEAFNTLDLFCLPSETEGLPLVVIEAMSCELPVVVTDIDSHRNIIKDGTDGILFEVNNSDALSRSIKKLLNGPALRNSVGRAAREKAVAEYDFSGNLKKIEELYRKCIR